MQKKRIPSSFTSLRIIGSKAQQFLERARSGIRKSEPGKPAAAPLPPEEALPEIVMHLSIKSVVKATFAVLAIAFGVLLLKLLQDQIILFILAMFLAVTIDPGVEALHRIGIPRGLGILIHYAIALFLTIFLVVSLVPIIATQLQAIASLINDRVNEFLANPTISLPLITDQVNQRLTEFTESLLHDLSINRFADALAQFGQSLSSATQSSLLLAARIAGSVVNFIMNTVIVLVLAFFMQMEKERIVAWTRSFLPRRYRAYADDKTEAIHSKLAQWARGQLLLCFAIGILVFLALVVLRMPYALTLALLAGFTEFIPVIGPLLAAIPAVLIALTEHGFLWALVIAAVYYVIQWCENNLLVPLIMKRAVGLSPIAILFAMMVGISFPNVIHPILGIILSIPATTIIALFLEDWREMRRE